MKKSSTLLFSLLAVFGLVLYPAFGQDAPEEPATDEPASSSEEVDKILAELGETTTSEEATVETDSEDVAVEEGGDTPDVMDPNAVPAISLEEATSVEGLEIDAGSDITEGLISVNYEDVPLADIVKIFAQTSGANIIIPQSLTEPVSGNLNDVFWRDALDVILADKGYVLVERSTGIFTINSVDDIAAEPLETDTVELQFITAEAALPAIQSMIISSNANVTPIPQTNVLIVNETAKQMQEIKRLIGLVDKPRSQVFIEAKFVELNDSAIQDLGINWSVLQNYSIGVSGLTSTFEKTLTKTESEGFARSSLSASSRSDTRQTDSLLTDVTGDLPLIGTAESREIISGSTSSVVEGSFIGNNVESIDAETGEVTGAPRMQQEIVRSAVLSASDFALTLSALQQLDGVRVVSNPKMLVANGQTARIHVGRNEPDVRAIPQGENATTFAYVLDGFIEIGVKLEVTPIVNTAKNITVNITPELSRLIGERVVGEAGTTFPITQIRRIETEFAVESGKTVAIGGLTQSDESEDVTKVPLLGDLPIIGKYLFTSTSTSMLQDEIIIFVSVDTARSDELNDRDGIPDEGKLIHTWLDYQDKEEDAPLRSLSQ